MRLLLDVGSKLSSVPNEGEFTTAYEHSTRDGRGTSGKSTTSRVIQLPQIRVGDITTNDVLVELQPEGWPHPPLLGAHVFEPYTCAFRFSQGRIDVDVDNNPAQGSVWGDGSTPVVDVVWDDQTTATAIWDTGAGITIVDESWARDHPEAIAISEHQDHGTDATGQAVIGWQGTLASFTIQGARFPGNQPCGIVDLSPFNAHMSEPISMFLGLPQIRQVDWIIDFPRRVITGVQP
jgi:hypothetical protein